MKYIIYIALLISFTLLSACSSDDCESTRARTTGLEALSCGDRAYDLSINTESDFELIRSQDDYARLVTGICNPTIDWTQYDLIIGNAPITHELVRIDSYVYRDCTNNVINLDVTIVLNTVEVDKTISWSALIPKLSDQESIYVHL